MYGEDRNYRFIFGLGAVILLLFVAIFLIVRSGGGNDEATVEETERELTSYVGDQNVSIVQTTIGPVTAPENHGEMQIVVTDTATTVDFMAGYDGNVVASRTYPHSSAAFAEFLHALEKYEFTNGNKDEALADDKGYCPTGNRYIFEIREGAETVQRFWATSCREPKTFRGNLGGTLDMFRLQIPDDYDDILDAAGVEQTDKFGF